MKIIWVRLKWLPTVNNSGDIYSNVGGAQLALQFEDGTVCLLGADPLLSTPIPLSTDQYDIVEEEE